MKAETFVKTHGLSHAKQVLSNADSGANKYVIDFNWYAAGIVTDDYVLLSELKRLIESHEIIQKDFESVEMADYEHMISGCYSDPYWIRVKQAIADVEACQ